MTYYYLMPVGTLQLLKQTPTTYYYPRETSTPLDSPVKMPQLCCAVLAPCVDRQASLVPSMCLTLASAGGATGLAPASSTALCCCSKEEEGSSCTSSLATSMVAQVPLLYGTPTSTRNSIFLFRTSMFETTATTAAAATKYRNRTRRTKQLTGSRYNL